MTILTATGSAGMGSMLITLVLMLAVFYFMLIRPENKRKKEAEQMRSAVKTGDKITTIGGIVGTVVNVKENNLVIETGADQVRIEIAKWAMSTNETAAEAAKAEAKKAQEAKAKAKAAKKAGRIAAEGMSYALTENGVGVVVEVNCETDFCAKSDLFVAFVKDICKVVLKDNPTDVDALMQCKYPNSELTVAETMPEKVMSIGENLQIRRFVRFAENTSVGYVHAGGKIGVLVNLAVEGGIDATEIGKNVAMQIAAMNPKYWDKSLVPQADVDHEMQVQVALMDNDPKMASKPAQVKEKIAAGKLNAFFKDNCLLQQEFVRSDLFQGSVEGYIADAAKKLGGKVTFVDAIHYVKGEGIEKKQEDFAAEVAAQMNMGK